MSESTTRLGDTIDDYCPRCRLLLNHNVASLVDGEVVKVICQTCHSEHPYRHAAEPPKRRPSPRAALFKEVLTKAVPAPAPGGPVAPPRQEIPAPTKKRAVAPARYISRRKTPPPRGGR